MQLFPGPKSRIRQEPTVDYIIDRVEGLDLYGEIKVTYYILKIRLVTKVKSQIP
jgi:hypothetical protein